MSSSDRDRRTHASLNLIKEIRALKARGYSAIQAVNGSKYCSKAYRFRIFYLLEHGDPRLIADVEQGRIPVTVATHIARARNLDLQRIFADGYNAGTVSGAQILTIRRIIDQYEAETQAPSIECSGIKLSRTVAADAVIRHFRRETDKQKQLFKKAKLVRSHLGFIVGALRQLFLERPFVALLRAEGIQTMPVWLSDRTKDQTHDA